MNSNEVIDRMESSCHETYSNVHGRRNWPWVIVIGKKKKTTSNTNLIARRRWRRRHRHTIWYHSNEHGKYFSTSLACKITALLSIRAECRIFFAFISSAGRTNLFLDYYYFLCVARNYFRLVLMKTRIRIVVDVRRVLCTTLFVCVDFINTCFHLVTVFIAFSVIAHRPINLKQMLASAHECANCVISVHQRMKYYSTIFNGQFVKCKSTFFSLSPRNNFHFACAIVLSFQLICMRMPNTIYPHMMLYQLVKHNKKQNKMTVNAMLVTHGMSIKLKINKSFNGQLWQMNNILLWLGRARWLKLWIYWVLIALKVNELLSLCRLTGFRLNVDRIRMYLFRFGLSIKSSQDARVVNSKTKERKTKKKTENIDWNTNTICTAQRQDNWKWHICFCVRQEWNFNHFHLGDMCAAHVFCAPIRKTCYFRIICTEKIGPTVCSRIRMKNECSMNTRTSISNIKTQSFAGRRRWRGRRQHNSPNQTINFWN